jgi:peptidoglycan/LPS O-acetylase OafA/YrhL
MKRVSELEGIRGLAAASIVGYHLIPRYFGEGWVAVDCFFVLSGYLITTILLKNRDKDHYYKTFYMRRALRIWPIYYLTLMSLVLANHLFHHYFPTDGFWLHFFYLQNVERLFGAKRLEFIPAFSHTWTLALEEQFYFLWPFAVRNLKIRWIFVASCLIAIVAIVLRGAGVSYVTLPARSDGFALGAILALILHHREAWNVTAGRLRILLGTSFALGLAMLVALALGPYTVRLPSGLLDVSWSITWAVGPFNLIFFAIIGFALCKTGSPHLALLRSRPLVYLGTISYGLYLYHIPVMHVAELVFRKFHIYHQFDGQRPLYRGLLELAISLVVADLSWRYVEQPILRLKDRFRYPEEPRIEPDPIPPAVETCPATIDPINS